MTEKTKIEVALLSLSMANARDACVQRLSDLLRAKEGIETAHLVDHQANGRDQICIHYDPNRLSIGEIRELAGRAGAELDKRLFGTISKRRSRRPKLRNRSRKCFVAQETANHLNKVPLPARFCGRNDRRVSDQARR